MKYQVWVKAHDPKTLAVIAETLGFEHEDRLEAERYNEVLQPAAVAAYLFGDYVLAQKPLYRAETRIPGWGGLAGNPGIPRLITYMVVGGSGGGNGGGNVGSGGGAGGGNGGAVFAAGGHGGGGGGATAGGSISVTLCRYCGTYTNTSHGVCLNCNRSL